MRRSLVLHFLLRRAARMAVRISTGMLLAALLRRITRFSFRDRVVLITGGSRGLGLVLARKLGKEGAQLMLVARETSELDRAAADLRSRGAIVRTLTADVTEPSTAEEAVAATIREFGHLDVLINNAGIIIVGPLENMTEADYEAALATHFWAPLRFMTAALPALKESRGRMVNIASVGGKIAVPHLAPYSASKFALAGLSEAFRVELAQSRVSVTTIFPGLLRTGSHLQALFKGHRDREFGWFALGSATPLTSMSAERAARQIVEACRERKAEVVLSTQAKLAVLGHSLFPNLSAAIAALVNRTLPAIGPAGEARRGMESCGEFPPNFVTTLPDQASKRNNEL